MPRRSPISSRVSGFSPLSPNLRDITILSRSLRVFRTECTTSKMSTIAMLSVGSLGCFFASSKTSSASFFFLSLFDTCAESIIRPFFVVWSPHLLCLPPVHSTHVAHLSVSRCSPVTGHRNLACVFIVLVGCGWCKSKESADVESGFPQPTARAAG